MRRNRELYNLERKYIGKLVKYYESDLPSRNDNRLKKYGPYYGTVLMLTNNELEAIYLGKSSYGFTGYLLIRPVESNHEISDVEISINDIYIVTKR